eukprot:4151271-Prymnesium_polylepis.2
MLRGPPRAHIPAVYCAALRDRPASGQHRRRRCAYGRRVLLPCRPRTKQDSPFGRATQVRTV